MAKNIEQPAVIDDDERLSAVKEEIIPLNKTLLVKLFEIRYRKLTYIK